MSGIFSAGGAGNVGVSGFYPVTIDDSLRFEDGSNAYLNRTPASAGNRKTFTYSSWVKRGKISADNPHWGISAGTLNNSSNHRTEMLFNPSDNIVIGFNTGSWYESTTDAVFRDVSAWYHFVVSVDMTQSTASDRMKLYVNGVLQTFSTYSVPNQNTDLPINNTLLHGIGEYIAGVSSSSYQFDGYLSDVYFIDGQALDPTSFGETKDGVWIPKSYSGSYGTNGFHLDFNGNTNDASGNGNDWTANNISAHDYAPDSPTNSFATLNPLNGFPYLSEGNLKIYGYSDGSNNLVQSSVEIPSSGKWYAEYCHTGAYGTYVGVSTISMDNSYGGDRISFYYNASGGYITTTGQSNDTSPDGWYSSSTYVLGFAVDSDSGTIKYYLDGVLQTTVNLPSGDGYHFTYANAGGGSNTGLNFIWNFGQDSSFAGNKTAQGNTDDNGIGDFYYAPPSGYLALCTANLPTPTIIDGSTAFSTVLYTGDGTNSNSVTGVGHAPDFVWFKRRDTAGYYHELHDTIRGADKALFSNATDAESTRDSQISFDSDGFTVGTQSGAHGGTNASGGSYVAWNWKAGGTAVSNTDGSITSQVSANVDAGFSIVGYTGTGVDGDTVGHGLTASAPELVIIKGRTGAGYPWAVYGYPNNPAFPNDGSVVYLDDTAAMTDSTGSELSLGASTINFVDSGANINGSGQDYICYAFHSVDGYLKAGSYTGNGSSDGPFVYTGFRPAWVMFKSSTSAESWNIVDSERNVYNVIDNRMYADSSAAESAGVALLDFTSNGFKLRATWGSINASGQTFIYLAFAEHPFKYANAR